CALLSLSGGHVELNEELLEAGLRELKEETGLELLPGEFTVSTLGLWEVSVCVCDSRVIGVRVSVHACVCVTARVLVCVGGEGKCSIPCALPHTLLVARPQNRVALRAITRHEGVWVCV
uniref:Nudix hydrolase domain-containing protein n=1 Tax=Callorhinchus milii TaxID=7868 RepID=A0A4W3GER8_CALMI